MYISDICGVYIHTGQFPYAYNNILLWYVLLHKKLLRKVGSKVYLDKNIVNNIAEIVYAFKRGDRTMYEYLISHGVGNVGITSKTREMIHFPIIRYSWNTRFGRSLMEGFLYNMCISLNMGYLYKGASMMGHLFIIKYIHTHSDEILCFSQIMENAAFNGHLHIIKYAMKKQIKYVMKRDIPIVGSLFEPLLIAIKYGHLHIVKYLLANCAILNVNWGASSMFSIYRAIKHTCHNGHLNILQYLVENYSRMFFKIFDTRDIRKLIIKICGFGRYYIFKYLIATGIANITTYYYEALIRACSGGNRTLIDDDLNGRLRIVKYITARFHVKMNEYNELLCIACRSSRCNLDIVKYLTERGADIHTNDDDGLMAAIFRTDYALIDHYMKIGITKDTFQKAITSARRLSIWDGLPASENYLERIRKNPQYGSCLPDIIIYRKHGK